MKRPRVVVLSLLTAGILVIPVSPATSEPGAKETSTVVVNIAGFRNAKGRADALMFVRPEGFPDDDSKAFDKDEGQIDPKTMTAQIVFKDVPRGFAAVTVLHDENMNRKMDKNWIGVPKEGYGTSNNPKKAAHNPRWTEAKFPVTHAEETISIKLIYW